MKPTGGRVRDPVMCFGIRTSVGTKISTTPAVFRLHDTVGIAVHYQGPCAHQVPLVGLQQSAQSICRPHAPEPVLRRV
ncbi:MAG: hypothetical protein GWN95_08070 [Gammaproteobacteria bacterium]|nr:hypothetical protein [Gammaproteobacteria bacterium]